MNNRIHGALTIDLEDYRRQELRDHRGGNPPPNPCEIERQLDILLPLLAKCGARATFFCVGRLSVELAPWAWRAILADGHRIGCHGYEHLRVCQIGPQRFASDLHKAKAALEDVSGNAVDSYRAPYFSGGDCDPWFGKILADEGFRLDSSRRLSTMPEGYTELAPLFGAGDAVREVPLFSCGPGQKRLTVIGGTYLRVLPSSIIQSLIGLARRRRFLPMVYLHPYDVDPASEPLEFGPSPHWRDRLRSRLHRIGRNGAAAKLMALSRHFSFQPLEDLFLFQVVTPHEPAPAAGGDWRGSANNAKSEAKPEFERP